MADKTTGVVPWGLHPLPPWVINEFENRTKEYGMNPNATDGKPFSGPRTAWTRVFSNGVSPDPAAATLDGFVLGGVFGFNDSYGFNNDKQAAIGVDAAGEYHTINQNGQDEVPHGDFAVRPPPSVTSVECDLFGSQNASFPSLCRKVKVNWRCFNLAQLNYMIPYFLTPRITLLVEWGWHNYDTIALVDLTDRQWVSNIFTDPSFTSEFVEMSNGNYDAASGFITDFGYSLNEMGGYDCHTTITNANFLIEGQAHNNQSIVKRKANNFVPQKTLKEFVQNDLRNVSNVDGQKILKELKIDTANIYDKIFSAKWPGEASANKDGKKWIRMDLFVDILNAFSSVAMTNSNDPTTIAKASDSESDGKTGEVRLNYLTIKDIRMSAHPALKSVNPDILFPNQFAPRFCVLDSPNKDGTAKHVNDVTTQKVESTTQGITDYGTLFKTVGSTITKYDFDSSFDDLKMLINRKGNSFPMFSPYHNDTLGTLRPGYYGYLADVFISVEMIQKLVGENDTILKLVESILQTISAAMCNISQLKLVSSEYGNKYYSISDSSLSYVNTESEANKLMRINVGSINSAFIRSAGFEVKISTDMMNQLVAQSANSASGSEDPNVSVVNNDPKRPPPNRYSAGDRLYAYGGLPATTEANPVSKEAKAAAAEAEGARRQAAVAVRVAALEQRDELRMKRLFSETHPIFYVYTFGSGADTKRYILAEKDSVFMTRLLTGTPDPHATYINNAIMPGTTFTMELLGISGITYLSQFTLDHVPNTYNYKNAVWQIADVKQKIENKVWTTSIVAEVRPLTIIST